MTVENIIFEKITGKLLLDPNFFYLLKQDISKVLDDYNLTSSTRRKLIKKLQFVVNNYTPGDGGLSEAGIWR